VPTSLGRCPECGEGEGGGALVDLIMLCTRRLVPGPNDAAIPADLPIIPVLEEVRNVALIVCVRVVRVGCPIGRNERVMLAIMAG
jgi:hypothetical protein